MKYNKTKLFSNTYIKYTSESELFQIKLTIQLFATPVLNI